MSFAAYVDVIMLCFVYLLKMLFKIPIMQTCFSILLNKNCPGFNPWLMLTICPGFDRFVEGRLQSLVTDERLTLYAHTLRTSMWPDGELSTEGRPVYTVEQKALLRDQATHCLGDFMPGCC